MNRKKYFIVATKLMQNVPRKTMQVSVRPDLAKFRHFKKIFKALDNIWSVFYCLAKIFVLSLANVIGSWANFHCCKGPNLRNIIYPSGHTGRYTFFG